MDGCALFLCHRHCEVINDSEVLEGPCVYVIYCETAAKKELIESYPKK